MLAKGIPTSPYQSQDCRLQPSYVYIDSVIAQMARHVLAVLTAQQQHSHYEVLTEADAVPQTIHVGDGFGD